MKKTLLIFSVALVLFTAAFALGAAKQTLHIYTAFDADQAEVYIKAFEQSHPDIEVKWVRLSSGQVLARIRAEAGKPVVRWFEHLPHRGGQGRAPRSVQGVPRLAVHAQAVQGS